PHPSAIAHRVRQVGAREEVDAGILEDVARGHLEARGPVPDPGAELDAEGPEFAGEGDVAGVVRLVVRETAERGDGVGPVGRLLGFVEPTIVFPRLEVATVTDFELHALPEGSDVVDL